MEEERYSPSPKQESFETATQPPSEPPYVRAPKEYMDKPKSSFPWRLALLALVVVVGSIGAIYAFSGAKVSITPRVDTATVGGEFSATPSSGELPFEIITVEKIGKQEVKAEGTENANDPAQGSITIYNGQEKVQELIKNTRFETPDGLIFRIHESVKVPAGTKANPGQLQVTAYADAGGEKYNIGPSTFTLPGLKGSAAFELVYAKSTSGMSGGFTGTRPSVSEKTREAQVASIHAALEKELRAAVSEKVQEGYVVVPGALTFSYSPLPSTAGDEGKVQVQENGIATAVIFPKNALAKAIASRAIGSYAGQDVTLETAEGLTLTPKEGVLPTPSTPAFVFTLSGNTKIFWIVDETKIAGSVAGKSRQASNTILAGFPEVEKAVLSLKPFWAGTMPQDPAEIKVIVDTHDTK